MLLNIYVCCNVEAALISAPRNYCCQTEDKLSPIITGYPAHQGNHRKLFTFFQSVKVGEFEKNALSHGILIGPNIERSV